MCNDPILTHIRCETCGADLHHFVRADDLGKAVRGVEWQSLDGRVPCLLQMVAGTNGRCMLREYGPADVGEFA